MSDEKKDQILSKALEAFFRYGYRRVNMKEIAEEAGISRQGLYLYFETKEEVYRQAVEQRAERLLDEIHRGIKKRETVDSKILYAFDIWTIRNFAAEINSPEAREINECTQAFMSTSFDEKRRKFEAILEEILVDHYKAIEKKPDSYPAKIAHLLYSSIRGFKLTAKSSEELKKMIQELLALILVS